MSTCDVAVVGAGVNGLAAAAVLAKRGRKVLLLERSDVLGGTNATEEFHPGYRAGPCRDECGWVPDGLLRELRLGRHGLQWADVPAGLVSVSPGSPVVATYPDIRRTIDELRQSSPSDAARWSAFCEFTAQVAGFLQAVYSQGAPRVQSRALGDLMAMARVGGRLRRLGRRQMMEVLRVVPMPVADLAEEWFSSEAVRTILAVQGTRDVMHGPLSGGTALVFLHHQVGAAKGSVGVRRVPVGGTGALVAALSAAARAAGVEVRLGAEVSQVRVAGGRATGVVLSTGETIGAAAVVSSADPQRSFSWIDPKWLDPELLRAVDNIRMRGATARVQFALDALPGFRSGGREVPRDALAGTLVMAPSVLAVERAYDSAKYGEVPDAPALSITVPTLTDPSLAPERRHVLSVTAHHVPYMRRGGWDSPAAEALGDRVTESLASIAPDIRDRIVHRRVLSPADLEARYGCTEGSLSHGELALDQFLFMRPVPQCAHHETPITGFWLCGTGTHPASTSGAGGMLGARAVASSRQASLPARARGTV